MKCCESLATALRRFFNICSTIANYAKKFTENRCYQMNYLQILMINPCNQTYTARVNKIVNYRSTNMYKTVSGLELFIVLYIIFQITFHTPSPIYGWNLQNNILINRYHLSVIFWVMQFDDTLQVQPKFICASIWKIHKSVKTYWGWCCSKQYKT